MSRIAGRLLLLTVLWATILVAGPVAAGDPPPPPAAEASSGAGPSTAPPTAKVAAPQLEAKAWAVADARTGEVLASHASSKRLPIASATKMMTAYVAMQELPLGKMVRAEPYESIYGESLLELKPGERISVRDLLYGLILRSGNDAAYDLALAAAGSEPSFVRQMNLRAAALGLADTHFANPIGLDQAGNYSSARDLIALGRRLLDMPAFARIAASRSAELRSLRPPREILTLNDFLYTEPWANGIKTGHTFDAAYVLVGSGERKGVQLVSAVLGAPTETARDLETIRLLDYGFSQYRRRVPIEAGEEMAAPSIRYAGGELPLRAVRTVEAGVRRGQRLSVSVRAPEEVEGAIRKGAILGRATVSINGRIAGTTPLRASRSIPKAGTFDRVRSFLSDNALLVALAMSAILIGVALLWRRVRRGPTERM